MRVLRISIHAHARKSCICRMLKLKFKKVLFSNKKIIAYIQ